MIWLKKQWNELEVKGDISVNLVSDTLIELIRGSYSDMLGYFDSIKKRSTDVTLSWEGERLDIRTEPELKVTVWRYCF